MGLLALEDTENLLPRSGIGLPTAASAKTRQDQGPARALQQVLEHFIPLGPQFTLAKRQTLIKQTSFLPSPWAQESS